MEAKLIRALCLLLIAVLVANIALFAFGKISWKLFWIVIIAAAGLAWYGVPWLRKRNG